MQVLNLFHSEEEGRKCKCGCGRSLDGFHGKREIHPDCEERVDKLRRATRRQQRITEKRRRMEEKFLEFHHRNPHIYRAILDKALELFRAGRRRYGIKALYEVVRWEQAIQTEGGEFKLNNNHAAFYARMIMDNVPQLQGFFTTRETKDLWQTAG
jgi:hypothetical protein